MQRRRTLAFLAVILMAILAGCAQESTLDQAQELDTSTFQEPGNLVVFVVTAHLEPIDGARVSVDDRAIVADQQGVALIEDLVPGDVLVHAAKDGYRSATQRVTIHAGQTVETRIKLLQGLTQPENPPEPETPREPQVFKLQGYFDCSATYVIITGDCALLLDTVVDEAFGAANETPPAKPGDLTSEEYVLEFPLDHDWSTIVAEMFWNETTLAGSRMTFAVEPAEAADDGHAAKYARAEGTSPLRIRLEPGVPHENATASVSGTEPDMPNAAGGEILRTRSYVQGELHRPGGTQFLGVGAAVNQKFDVIVTVFYGEAAPEGYTTA